MDKQTDLSVFRSRTAQACIADGYRLYAKNFSRLWRSSWLVALVYALVTGASLAYFFTNVLPALLGSAEGLAVPLVIWGVSLLLFVSAAFALACWGAFAPLNDHRLTGVIARPTHWWGRWPLGLPLRALLRAAVRTVRLRFGTTVLILLVTSLVVLFATMLLQLPAVILALANVKAQMGVAAGDPLDMPTPLFAFNMAVFTVFAYIQAYIHLTMLFPLYYAWGGILKVRYV